jgi:ABC transporter substrate binding protein
MRRRSFLTLLATSAAAWPLAARAQQPDRVRRIGVLMPLDENDLLEKPRVSAFTQALAGLGWTDGSNMRIDVRWFSGDINRTRALAQELVGLQPDIILASSTPATMALQRETRTIPIVFVDVADPVANGVVARLDRPSGNTTGFATLEASLGGKWLELLSEVAAGLSVLIPGRLHTNAATSCETQLPFWMQRHPRRIVATLPCAGAKCGAARPIVPDRRRARRRFPYTPLLNRQSNPSGRLG